MLRWLRKWFNAGKVSRKYWFRVTIDIPVVGSELHLTADMYVIDTSGDAAFIQLQRKLRYGIKNAKFKSSTVKKIETVKSND